ncbi:hypothetical protein M0R45_005680 [Rubus argutus]|uniref:TFA2 Winged helix domain-containing protein n=1 Tax=Rubus argutus TaxID=59490 RepID=A0AAW1YNZ9_RUBAR
MAFKKQQGTVGAQMKRVIDLLLETMHAFTPKLLNETCNVDVNANKAVFESLRNNPKVYYDGKQFCYKSKPDVKDKNELGSLVRKFSEGILVIDVKDSYPTVMEDLQALKAAGDIWLISNLDSQEDIIAYPNGLPCTKVDDEIKLLFHEIELPRNMLEIEKDLQKNGMKPAEDTARRRGAMAQSQGIQAKSKSKKKKKNEINKRTKLTNSHIPELFKN